MSLSQHEKYRALSMLGVSQYDFEAIHKAPFVKAQTLFDALKSKVHRNYKKLVPKLHPDHTQGDKEKTELFILLGQVVEEIDKMILYPAPPQKMQVQVSSTPVVTWQQFRYSGTHGTNNTVTTSYRVVRIVSMRPRA